MRYDRLDFAIVFRYKTKRVRSAELDFMRISFDILEKCVAFENRSWSMFANDIKIIRKVNCFRKTLIFYKRISKCSPSAVHEQ